MCRGICTDFNIHHMITALSYCQILWIWELLEARASTLRKGKRLLLYTRSSRQCEGQKLLKVVSRKVISPLWRSRTINVWVKTGSQEIFHNFLFPFSVLWLFNNYNFENARLSCSPEGLLVLILGKTFKGAETFHNENKMSGSSRDIFGSSHRVND